MTDGEQILRTYLTKIAAEQNYNDFNLSIKEISSGGANYTSKLFTAVIDQPNKNDLHLFAKIAVISQKVRDEAGLKIYDTENFFYTNLWTTYKSIEDFHGLNAKQKLSLAECYGCNSMELQEIVVLENLEMKGYRPFNRFTAIDWEYASSAIKELVKLHALSFAFNKKYLREYNDCINKLKDAFTEDTLAALSNTSMDLAVQHTKPENKELVKKYIDSIMKESLTKVFDPVLKPVICHYDFRPSNLMSKTLEDGSVEIKIVDLQTMQGGSPVVDLLYFIFTGSDAKFRAQYYDKLINYYYEELSEAMKRLRLDPEELYSRADFDYELKTKLRYGLALAVFTLPIVTVDTANAPTVDENMDLNCFAIETANDLYAERLNGVVNDFVKWGILN